ncbi:MAG TPA: FAD-dependent thymidylate synthase, partial [Syntrophales bacterium]|nr:FAD-dependent thymidylate synthase [Syntrophales bacterium]
KERQVSLVYATPDGDDRVIASLIHSSSDLPMSRCLRIVSSMERKEKESLIRATLRHIKSYDPVLREFENAELHFELIISASCFAQMKRHRIATITCQDYDPALGATVPPAVSEVGMEKAFKDVLRRSEDMYERLEGTCPAASRYILTNAHRRRVSMKINARELYHIARLRGDAHAQWDIRNTADEMVRLGRKVMPIALMLASGKDAFPSLYDRVIARVTHPGP